MTNAEAIKYLKSKLDGKTDSSQEWTEVVRLAINALEKTNEVPYKHWIDKGILNDYPKPGINVFHLLWCPECGALHRARPYCEGGWINANFCPNCGVKMDKEDNS